MVFPRTENVMVPEGLICFFLTSTEKLNQKVDFFGKMSGELITPKEIVKEVIRAQSA